MNEIIARQMRQGENSERNSNDEKATNNANEWKRVQNIKLRNQPQMLAAARGITQRKGHRMSNRDKTSMHNRINRTKGVFSKGCIKCKEGTLIIEKKNQRVSEYVRELSFDEREKPTTQKNLEGLEIIKSELISALDKLKKSKAAELDVIVIEMLATLDDFGIDKIFDET